MRKTSLIIATSLPCAFGALMAVDITNGSAENMAMKIFNKKGGPPGQDS